MPRYELAGAIWQIEQTEAQLAITTAGKTTLRTFRTPDHAAAQLTKLVGEQLAAGYQPAGDPRHPALEAAVASEPEQPLAYSVYADWLQSQGEPRGALSALQIAAETTGDPKLAAAFARELDRNAAYLMGPLAPLAAAHGEGVATFAWRFGYIHRAHLTVTHHAPLDQTLAALLGHPSGRFVVELTMVGRDRMQAAVDVLVQRAPASLRGLRLWATDKIDLVALREAVPRLRRLSLSGHALVLGELAFPELERLQLTDSEPSAATSRALARATLPALGELRLDFGDDFATGDASIDDVFEMLHRRDFRLLSSLALRHTRYIREVVLELASSPLAAQLTTLDLASNHMTDVHARQLAAHRDKFPRLAHLDVSRNELSAVGLAALATICADVRASNQDTHR